jgi:hypothetical protein
VNGHAAAAQAQGCCWVACRLAGQTSAAAAVGHEGGCGGWGCGSGRASLAGCLGCLEACTCSIAQHSKSQHITARMQVSFGHARRTIRSPK